MFQWIEIIIQYAEKSLKLKILTLFSITLCRTNVRWKHANLTGNAFFLNMGFGLWACISYFKAKKTYLRRILTTIYHQTT